MKNGLLITILLFLLKANLFADVFVTTGLSTVWEDPAAWICTGTCGGAIPGTPNANIVGDDITIDHPITSSTQVTAGATNILINDVLTFTSNFIVNGAAVNISGPGTLTTSQEFRLVSGSGHMISVANLNARNLRYTGSTGTDISSSANISRDVLYQGGDNLNFTGPLTVGRDFAITGTSGSFGTEILTSTNDITIGGDFTARDLSRTPAALGAFFTLSDVSVGGNFDFLLRGSNFTFTFGNITSGTDFIFNGAHNINATSVNISGDFNVMPNRRDITITNDFTSGSITSEGTGANIIIGGDLNTGDITLEGNGDLTLNGALGNVNDVSLDGGSEIVGTGTLNFNTITTSGGSEVCMEESPFFDDIISVDLSNCTFVLPIQLAFFNAQTQNESVKLNWQTLSETNNDFFTVEYSFDGINYFNSIVVDGAGDSFSPLDYEFTIPQFSSRNDLVYFRLKQTDFDGSYSYSSVVPVSLTGDDRENFATLFPNPTSGLSTLTLAQYEDDKVYEASLVNVLSLSSSFDFVIVNAKTELDLSDLAPGFYFLKVKGFGSSLKIVVN